MEFIASHRRGQGTALGAVSCFVAAALLAGCGGPKDFADIYVQPPQPGLSAQTMSGIVMTQNLLAASPDDKQLPYVLAFLYMQAVRENADTDFYLRAERVVDRLEDKGADLPDNDFLRGLVAMGRHDFREALRYGEKLTYENPETQRYYGLLTDARIELGMYDEAVDSLQTMADLNPDASVMTRIAYVREIHGDVDGAREAMQDALRQGGVPENVAWSVCELARLWLHDDPAKAAGFYDQALLLYPNYAPALAGKAKAAMKQKKMTDALAFAQQAFTILPLPEYAALLGDIYAATGDTAKAQSQYTLVKLGYAQIAASGTDVSLERMRFLAEHDMDLPETLIVARDIYDERPTIYAADLLALALFKNGKIDEAKEYMEKALETGSKDPQILRHATEIK